MVILVLIALALIVGLVWAAVTVMIPTCVNAIKRRRAITTDADRVAFREWLHTPLNKSMREGK